MNFKTTAFRNDTLVLYKEDVDRLLQGQYLKVSALVISMEQLSCPFCKWEMIQRGSSGIWSHAAIEHGDVGTFEFNYCPKCGCELPTATGK